MTGGSLATVVPLPIDGVVPYPDEYIERYRANGLWIGQTLDAFLREAVAGDPHRLAIIDGEHQITYGELDHLVARAATLLRGRLQLSRGDRVIVQLPNISEFVIITFAMFRLGVIPIFALPAHRRTDLLHFAHTGDAVGIVTRRLIAGFDHARLAREVIDIAPTMRDLVLVDDLREDLRNLPPAGTVAVSPADVAFLQLSGGTTGTPKLIARTHDDYLFSVRESARICELGPDSRMLVAIPISHNFTMSSPGILGIIHARGCMVLTEDPSPATALELIARHRVTIVPTVPPLAIGWMNSPEIEHADLSSLRVLQVGGAKLSRSVATRIEPTFGCRLQQVFGMAEGLVNYTRIDDDLDTIVSTQGLRISPADEVRVVDERDQPVPPGTPGALLTRGPYTIRGYFRAPEHNARSFTPDGFYRTGDLVIEREDGYLTVVGRVKDQINRGGEKIAPEEVENALLAHPDIHDVSVTGIPDEVLGERIHAHIVLRRTGPGQGQQSGQGVDDGADGASGGSAGPDVKARSLRPVDLRRFLAAQGLATYKIPDVFALVEALPETGVGKIDRRRLSQAPGAPPRDLGQISADDIRPDQE
ncbi:(2,3-dihydroxybenzoyl)adenylate synthase [Devriesea agamarum]|uniref:(2,3-dihydroxybenzoyl)adenylate synthase n=1 Tax=Devriesea agamarum TaxID=472569 RepID=UPI00071CCEB1|nr:AMP-binding protein [Devriesea agamarum]